jgi:predicted nucleic acid-binding protein
MNIVVDANIIFSGILNSNGKIGDLLINSGKIFTFIAPEYLRMEIYRHYNKLMQIFKLSMEQLLEAEYQLYQFITFLSEEQIETQYWQSADKFVSDIDPKDIAYIAFSQQFDCKLWSGDKQLHRGLLQKNFHRIITTDELFALRNTLLFA